MSLGGYIMQVTFGIDVSKSNSTVCELIGESKNELTITNDRPGFIQLLHELAAFSKHPQIIFEATGVYSCRLQAFLEDYGYEYVVLNPLKAKKEMNMGLRYNKTDKTDAYHLAYPVVSCSDIEVQQAQYYARRLLNLSNQRQRIITKMVKLAKTLPNHDLENLESIPGFAQTTAVRVLAELGDLRRFSNPNKINAFIGIDPGRYQSGEMDSNLSITKHGNAVARKLLYRAIGQIDNAAKTNIADYYESKKLSSQTKGFKKIAIASIHKLIRTIYALIINDQPYDYNVATHNQKDFSRN